MLFFFSLVRPLLTPLSVPLLPALLPALFLSPSPLQRNSDSTDGDEPTPKKRKAPVGAPLTGRVQRQRSLAEDIMASAATVIKQEEPEKVTAVFFDAPSAARPPRRKTRGQVTVKLEAVEEQPARATRKSKAAARRKLSGMA